MRLTEMRPPAPTWTEENIQDLSGQTYLVTGGNTGIGYQTCLVLARKGAKVWLAARNQSKGEDAVNRIRKETGSDKVHFTRIDLGDLAKLKTDAEAFLEKEKRLDVAILNAGVMVPPLGSETENGIEMQFGTNVVGHIALFEHIKPLLLSTAKSQAPGNTRVVVLSSSGHGLAPSDGIDFDDLHQKNKKRFYTPNMLHNFRVYGSSKLGNVLMASEIAKQHPELLAVSLNPGNIETDLTRHSGGGALGGKLGILWPVAKGALTQLYCATSPDVTMKDNGNYFIPFARRASTDHPKAQDAQLAERNWQFALEQMRRVNAAAASA